MNTNYIFYDDLLHEQRKYPIREIYYTNGSIMERTTLYKGRPFDITTRWHANGNLHTQCSYDLDGKLFGKYYTYYPSHQIEEEKTYVNGKLHGEYKKWYASQYPAGYAKLDPEEEPRLYIRATYVNNELYGDYTVYNMDGSVYSKGYYPEKWPI